jgi:hypothetical protein
MPKTAMGEDRDFTAPTEDEVLQAVSYDPIDALGPAGHLGDRPEIEKELDLIAAAIRRFHALPPDRRRVHLGADPVDDRRAQGGGGVTELRVNEDRGPGCWICKDPDDHTAVHTAW